MKTHSDKITEVLKSLSEDNSGRLSAGKYRGARFGGGGRNVGT